MNRTNAKATVKSCWFSYNSVVIFLNVNILNSYTFVKHLLRLIAFSVNLSIQNIGSKALLGRTYF